MMASVELQAPAKLNLFLHITARRADGYHELQTAFVLIDLADKVELVRRDDGVIRLTRPLVGVAEADDLCVQAAKLLRARADARAGSAGGQTNLLGADIRVQKNIPMGGGLGGGSSDAASVLRGLNELWSLGFNLDSLASIGLELGADVPVFVRARNAWAEGIGEILTPIVLQRQWYLVVTPACHVPTADIFVNPTLTRNTPKLKIADFVRGGAGARALPGAGIELDARHLFASTRNDCEPLVAARYPQVREALDCLSRFGAPRMTGTGASVFVCFDAREAAVAAGLVVPGQCQAFVVQSIDASQR